MDFPVERIDKEALLQWMNFHLQKRGLSARNIADDVQDGNLLRNLIDLLVPNAKQGKIHSRQKENTAVLNYFDRENRKEVRRFVNKELARYSVNVNLLEEDVFGKKIDVVLIVIFFCSINPMLTLRRNAAKQFILSWVKKILGSYGIVATDLTKSWENGIGLYIILSSINQTEKLHLPSTGGKEELFEGCKSLSLANLGIPLLFGRDVTFSDERELNTLLYFSAIKEKMDKSENKKESREAQESFDTAAKTAKTRLLLPSKDMFERNIRVFLCTTHGDTDAEARQFLENGAKQLNKLLGPLGISITFVTCFVDDYKRKGKLPQYVVESLRQAESCNYFVSVIEKSYGWVPNMKKSDEWSESASIEYPFLIDFGGKSVTELQLYHCVFSPNPSASRALFYFGNAAGSMSQTMSLAQTTADTIIGIEENQRVKYLKEYISDKFEPKMYESREQLTELIIEDLLTLIRADFKDKTMDPTTDYAHIYTLQQHLASISGRDVFIKEIFDKIQQNFLIQPNPIFLTGKIGSGKSSVMSGLIDLCQREKDSNTHVFYHFVGCNIESSNIQSVERRLDGALCEAFSIERIPDQQSKESLALLLKKAGNHPDQKFIIFVDGVEKLAGGKKTQNPAQLNWIPDVIPSNVATVFSTAQNHPSQKRALDLGFDVVQIPVLSNEEAASLIKKKLLESEKTVPEIDVTFLRPELVNPTVLRDLCDTTKRTHGEVGIAKLFSQLRACADIPSFYRQLVQSWEEKHGKKIVHAVLSSFIVSANGFTENELDDYLVEKLGAELDCNARQIFFLEFKGMIISKNGRFVFPNGHLREVAKSVVFYEERLAQEERRLFSKWLCKRNPNADELSGEVILEICDALYRGGCFEELASFLSQESVIIEMLRSNNRGLFSSYWAQLKGKGVDESAHLIPLTQGSTLAATETIQYFLGRKKFDIVESIVKKRLESTSDEALKYMDYDLLAHTYLKMEKLEEALDYATKALLLKQSSLEDGSRHIAASHELIGKILEKKSNFPDALVHFQKAMDIRKANNSNGMSLASSLGDVARTFYHLSKYQESLELYKQSLAAKICIVGDFHEEVALTHNNLGNVYERLKEYETALKEHERSKHIRIRIFNESSVEMALSLNNIANVYKNMGRYIEAKELYQKALVIFTQKQGAESKLAKVTEGNVQQLDKLLARQKGLRT